uniref:RRM domain-containing protein n=1 Tax=Acrobeloides nanus TaxID=290746 RepID=A0A914CMC6_9BILA
MAISKSSTGSIGSTVCLEQVAMEFNNLLKREVVENSSAIRATRYGRKVFLGGLPVGITSEEILANFERFGPARVDWPHKAFHENVPPSGYAFIIFESSAAVNQLIDMCAYIDYKHVIGIRTIDGTKRVIEVKPWDIKNTELVSMNDWSKYERLSIFIGGLPRTITAGELASLIQEAVGGVAYVGIEIDEHTEYPKGAAKIVFNSQEAYVRAIAMREITVLSNGNERAAEIKPFLQPKMKCESCNCYGATSFCSQIRCLKYFCDACWKAKHSAPGLTAHKPMQKGRYYFTAKNNKDDKVLRRDASRSQPLWQNSSNSTSLELLSIAPSTFINKHLIDPRLRYRNSYDSSAFGTFSPEISPALTAFSNDSVFDFTKQ